VLSRQTSIWGNVEPLTVSARMRAEPGKEGDAVVETARTRARAFAPHDGDACRTRLRRLVGGELSGRISLDPILGRRSCSRPPPSLNEVREPRPRPWSRRLPASGRLPASVHIGFWVYHRWSATFITMRTPCHRQTSNGRRVHRTFPERLATRRCSFPAATGYAFGRIWSTLRCGFRTTPGLAVDAPILTVRFGQLPSKQIPREKLQ
jgi:hypothetical protein